MKKKSWSARIRQRAKLRSGAGTVGTIAFYGPDNRHASKVVVGIMPDGADEITALEKWHEKELDVRLDPAIGREVEAYLKYHDVRRVGVADGIIGCPHEEGVDYPEGGDCPECPFWQGKDRFEHARPE